jgi:single-strand DNA-binding protein
MGRITKDIELRRTPAGVPVASFTVAVDRDFKSGGEKETDFIDCVAWRGTGEFVERNFSKGKMIIVAGRLQIRKWEDKNGNKRNSAEIVAENVYFGDSKSSPGEKYEAAMSKTTQDFAVLDGDSDDLPFDLPF